MIAKRLLAVLSYNYVNDISNPSLELALANVRIAELEETIKNDPKFDCFISRKELLDLRACKKREQKLVECLEMFVGYCTDEFAPTPMKLARELLKAHRGER